jgi:hypothetical protein
MRFFVAIVLAALLLASGCEFGEGTCNCVPFNPFPAESLVLKPAGGMADPPGGQPVTMIVSGSVTYDRLPVSSAGLGATPVVENAAFVTVEAAYTISPYSVFASATADSNGDYSFSFITDHDFYVRARSEAGPDRVFYPSEPNGLLHSANSAVLHRTQLVQTVDLHASIVGLNAPPTVNNSAAGAFAILDTVRRLREASGLTLGELDVFWLQGESYGSGILKVADTNTTQTKTKGPNGRPAIFLRGGDPQDPANTDHDEFDETVIAHEWASFLQLMQSRDNNFGGAHAGEDLLPTTAYSEGVVTAIGCALLGTSVYRDTIGFPVPGGATSVQFEFDCESGLLPGTGQGYGGEFPVTRVVWDLLDGGVGWPADADADPVAIDQADFFASFAALRTRVAPYEVAWLPSLLQQLIDDGFLSVADADTLMQSQGAMFPPPGVDPFPELLVVGGGAIANALDAWSGATPNPVLGPQANAVFRIELAAPQTITFTLANTTGAYEPARHRLDLSVHDLERNIVAADIGPSLDKQAQADIPAGTYIVRVQHVPDSQALSESATFMIQAQ